MIPDISSSRTRRREAERYGVLAQAAAGAGAGVYRGDGRGDPRHGPPVARAQVRRHRPRSGRQKSRAASTSWARIHILVNNAATLDHAAQLEHQAPELWERDLSVNLTGAFNCCAGRLAAHEGTGVGADREHGLRRGNTRRLRPGELLDDQGGAPRPHQVACARGRPPRDHGRTRSSRRSSAPRPSTSAIPR